MSQLAAARRAPAGHDRFPGRGPQPPPRALPRRVGRRDPGAGRLGVRTPAYRGCDPVLVLRGSRPARRPVRARGACRPRHSSCGRRPSQVPAPSGRPGAAAPCAPRRDRPGLRTACIAMDGAPSSAPTATTSCARLASTPPAAASTHTGLKKSSTARPLTRDARELTGSGQAAQPLTGDAAAQRHPERRAGPPTVPRPGSGVVGGGVGDEVEAAQ